MYLLAILVLPIYRFSLFGHKFLLSLRIVVSGFFLKTSESSLNSAKKAIDTSSKAACSERSVMDGTMKLA